MPNKTNRAFYVCLLLALSTPEIACYQSFAADNTIIGTIVGFDCGEATYLILEDAYGNRQTYECGTDWCIKGAKEAPSCGGTKGKVSLNYIGTKIRAKIGLVNPELASEGYYIDNIKFIKPPATKAPSTNTFAQEDYVDWRTIKGPYKKRCDREWNWRCDEKHADKWTSEQAQYCTLRHYKRCVEEGF